MPEQTTTNHPDAQASGSLAAQTRAAFAAPTIAAAAALLGLIGSAVAQPWGAPIAAAAATHAAVGLFTGAALCLLARTSAALWPLAFLAAQGARFFLVALTSAGVYGVARPEPMATFAIAAGLLALLTLAAEVPLAVAAATTGPMRSAGNQPPQATADITHPGPKPTGLTNTGSMPAGAASA